MLPCSTKTLELFIRKILDLCFCQDRISSFWAPLRFYSLFTGCSKCGCWSKTVCFLPGRLAVRNKETVPRPVPQVSPWQRRRRGDVHENRQSLRCVCALSDQTFSISEPSITELIFCVSCFTQTLFVLHSLTNEQSRQNWEIYGNPDGPGGELRLWKR